MNIFFLKSGEKTCFVVWHINFQLTLFRSFICHIWLINRWLVCLLNWISISLELIPGSNASQYFHALFYDQHTLTHFMFQMHYIHTKLYKRRENYRCYKSEFRTFVRRFCALSLCTTRNWFINMTWNNIFDTSPSNRNK